MNADPQRETVLFSHSQGRTGRFLPGKRGPSHKDTARNDRSLAFADRIA